MMAGGSTEYRHRSQFLCDCQQLFHLHATHLKKISYGRIILEPDETACPISEVSAVGNKWQDFYVCYANNQIVPDALINSYNTSYLSIVNNQKTAATTHPRKEPITSRTNAKQANQPSLQIQNLQPGHQVFAEAKTLILQPAFLQQYKISILKPVTTIHSIRIPLR